jgi:hypothetical protein
MLNHSPPIPPALPNKISAMQEQAAGNCPPAVASPTVKPRLFLPSRPSQQPAATAISHSAGSSSPHAGTFDPTGNPMPIPSPTPAWLAPGSIAVPHSAAFVRPSPSPFHAPIPLPIAQPVPHPGSLQQNGVHAQPKYPSPPISAGSPSPPISPGLPALAPAENERKRKRTKPARPVACGKSYPFRLICFY